LVMLKMSEVRIDTKADAGSGYLVGVANTSTASDGSWSFGFSASECADIYGIRLQETNADYCSEDGRDPDYPVGAWNTGANTVEWTNLPDSAGPITFYDQCEVLSTPTPTLPPTRCSECPGCYLSGPSRETGSNTVNLDWEDQWTVYVPFTAEFSGRGNCAVIKAGSWNAIERIMTCKITNWNGTVDISVEGESAAFGSGSGDDWRRVDFVPDFNVIAGNDYRLYCQGAVPWPSTYWIYDINLGGIIDGKTHAICMEEVIPTSTPTPTPCLGTIRGTIWDDINGDAFCDVGELTFDGVPILYNGGEGSVSPSGGLDCGGVNYQFNNIPAGRDITVYYDPDDLPGDYEPTTIVSDTVFLNCGVTEEMRSFGVSEIKPLWFQVAGGGIWAGSGPAVSVPDGKRLIIDDEDGNQVGVLVTGSGDISSVILGEDSLISEKEWRVVDQSYSGPNYYVSYFENRFEGSENVINVGGNEDSLSEVDGLDDFCGLATCSFDADSVIILRRNQSADFTIDRNITVANGGFFILLSKGNLIVEGGITRLDGLYLAEDVFEIEDGDSQLIINGSVADVGGGGILVKRNLEADNKNNPGMIFNYRPDLLINMPSELLKTRYEIEELLP